MNTEMIIGTGAAVLAVVGVYYAVKQSKAGDSGGPVAPASIYSIVPGSIGGGGGGFAAPVVQTGGTVAQTSNQLGDLTAALSQQTEVAKIQADNNFKVSVLDSINRGANQILARGADLQGRHGGTMTLDLNTDAVMDAGGSPIHSVMAGHLVETVPDAVPLPAPIIQAAPAPIIITPAPPPAPVVQESGGFCFITTAVCVYFNLPDDCDALTTLRSLRDNFMMKYEPYRSMVDEYYENAPRIVEKLSKISDNAKYNCYHDFYTAFIMPSVLLIKAGRYEEAVAKYEELYRYAMDLAGLECKRHSLRR